MKLTTSLLLAIAINLTASSAHVNQELPTSTESTVRLRGVITDSVGAVVPSTKVIVQNNGSKREAMTNEGGEYHIDLPPGLYTITTEKSGFCPARRAVLLPTNSSNTEINLRIGAAVNHGPCEFRYESLSYNAYSKVETKWLVQLGNRATKREQMDQVEYIGYMASYRLKGLDGEEKIQHAYVQIVVCYNALTICANRIIFDKATSQLEAEGGVIVENGKERKRYKRVWVDISALDPEQSLIGER